MGEAEATPGRRRDTLDALTMVFSHIYQPRRYSTSGPSRPRRRLPLRNAQYRPNSFGGHQARLEIARVASTMIGTLKPLHSSRGSFVLPNLRLEQHRSCRKLSMQRQILMGQKTWNTREGGDKGSLKSWYRKMTDLCGEKSSKQTK